MSRTALLRVAVLGVPAAACVLGCVCPAQQLIGYVPKRDATVVGSTDELEGQAVLMGSASVTAKEDHTAPIKLSRGGMVRVCQTSELKITESKEVSVAAPLLFSVNRGAVEIQTDASSSDQIMTPDLRFVIRAAGPLDLRVRVARNGDTCVENRGSTAPTLAVSDAFGESMYEVAAGQHVLFEHGSVREVVDHETIPCGCPERGSSVAEAMLAPGGARTGTGQEPMNPAAMQHPFPMAQSAGLTPTERAGATEPSPAAETATPQISDALAYSGGLKDPDELNHADASKPAVGVTAAPKTQIGTRSVAAKGAVPAVPKPSAPVTPVQSPKQQEPQPNDLAHIIGRAFRKLFGR